MGIVYPKFALGKSHLSVEIWDAIANLLSVYKRQKRVFNDGPSNLSDDSRRTCGQSPQRQSSAKAEALRCHTMVNTHDIKQVDSPAPRSLRDESRYAPRKSVDHREGPSADLVDVVK